MNPSSEPARVPSKVPPLLVAALLCDCGAVDQNSGKFTLVGLFSEILAATFPTTRSMGLYFKLSGAIGWYPVRIQLWDLEQDAVVLEGSAELVADDKLRSHTVFVDLGYVPFEHHGRYEFRISASEMYLGAAVLDVRQLQVPR